MVFTDISYLELWRPFCSGEQNHWSNFSRRLHKEQLRKIIFYLDLWFRRLCCLKIFLSRALAALLFSGVESFVQFGRGNPEEQFCEIILNLDLWYRRCCLKYSLSGLLAALLFSAAEPFM